VSANDEKADPYNFFREYVRLEQHEHFVFPSTFLSLGSRNGAANVAAVRRPVSRIAQVGVQCHYETAVFGTELRD
jgi:hypothetical protein